MTGEQLYTLATTFNGGDQMDETVFYQLLNMQKDMREMSRDWMKLRAIDTSKSFASSDDYTSTKALPARFLRPYNIDPTDSGVSIVTSEGNKIPLQPIALAKRYDYRNSDGYFYLDLANNAIGRTGSLAGTLHLAYLQGTEDLDDEGEWSFPSFAHPLLAFDVVMMNKGQIDWDTVNQSQLPYSEATIRTLESQLAMWDARLQQAELGV
jgi:hypothetical protein